MVIILIMVMIVITKKMLFIKISYSIVLKLIDLKTENKITLLKHKTHIIFPFTKIAEFQLKKIEDTSSANHV